MTPRGLRKLAEPEPFLVTVACGRFDVIVEEVRSRPGYVVMRRWRPGKPKGQWQRKSLGRMELRDARGAVLATATMAARHEATKWYHQLTGEIAAAPAEAEAAPFTIGQTWAVLTNVETGKYPRKTPFRDEVEYALTYARSVWGPETAWASISTDEWTRLIRRRITELVKRGKTGIRATEITVSRLMTIVHWLRLKKRIPANAAEPDPTWHDDLIAFWKGLTKREDDPEPQRDSYTLEESRKLLHASWNVDPRCGLLMALGAELRLGQVKRARRSDLDLAAAEFGQLTVRGAGDKKGEVVELTRGQRAAVDRCLVDGYLREFELRYRETGEDYLLFPGGKLSGRKRGAPYVSLRDPDAARPISRTGLSRRWPLIEFLAGIEHVDGRGAYGCRRAGVNAALEENISEHGLMALGGWTGPDVPRRIYADRENRAGRADARRVRAHIRGETD